MVSHLPAGFDVTEWNRAAYGTSGVPFGVADPVTLRKLAVLHFPQGQALNVSCTRLGWNLFDGRVRGVITSASISAVRIARFCAIDHSDFHAARSAVSRGTDPPSPARSPLARG